MVSELLAINRAAGRWSGDHGGKCPRRRARFDSLARYPSTEMLYGDSQGAFQADGTCETPVEEGNSGESHYVRNER